MTTKSFSVIQGLYVDGNIEGNIHINKEDISVVIEVSNPGYNDKYSHVIILKNKDRILANISEVKL